MTLISLQQPVAGDLWRIAGAWAVARELERAADHAAALARAGRRLLGLPAFALPDGVDAPLATARSMLGRALAADATRDRDLAAAVWEADDELDAPSAATCCERRRDRPLWSSRRWRG